MRIGVSTACLYPLELEKGLDELLSMDFRLFEIFFNTVSELEPDFVKEMKVRIDAHGAQVKSVHPFTSAIEGFLLFSEYNRRYEDGLEFYKRYFEACNLLGATILVLHGQRALKKDGSVPPPAAELYFERYAGIYRLGQTFGVTVAQENVNLFRSQSPSFIRRMREQLGEECAFVLDVKQAVRAEKNPFEMCKAMGDKIVHVHLNDNRPGQDCLLPGAGTMDFYKLMRILRSFDYNGDIMLEVYRSSFGELSELDKSKATVQQIISKNT